MVSSNANGVTQRRDLPARRKESRLVEFLLRGLLTAVVAGCVAIGIMHLSFGFTQRRDPSVDWSERAESEGLRPPRRRSQTVLRFAVATMVNPEATFADYRRLVRHISESVTREPAFVLHDSYAETRGELESGRLDVALVCTGTYALSATRVELLAQPEFTGGLQYRSVVLVPAASRACVFQDLQGKVMGFTDPESNTGCMVPTDFLLMEGTTPERFFRKVVFTGSHDRSIRAVALGIVDAAAVDSLVLVPTVQRSPALGACVRVLWESEPFGPPCIVVPNALDDAMKRRLRRAFLQLHESTEGAALLRGLGISRFGMPRPEEYRTALELAARVRSNQAAGR